MEGNIVIGGFRGQGEEDVEEEQMERKIDQPVRPIKFITRSDWLVDRFDGCNGMDGIIYVGQTETERGFNNHEWTIIIKCANLNTSPGWNPPPDQTRWGDKGRGSGWSGSICLICWLGYLEPHFRGAGGGSDCCSISNEPEWARKSLRHIIQKHRMEDNHIMPQRIRAFLHWTWAMVVCRLVGWFWLVWWMDFHNNSDSARGERTGFGECVTVTFKWAITYLSVV